MSIFDGLPVKKLEPVNFIQSTNSSKIGRVQFFARQTVKNGQNRKISLYYVQTDRLASKTKVSLVFEDMPILPLPLGKHEKGGGFLRLKTTFNGQ